MAATGFLIPADVDLEAIVGADFSSTIQLFSDTAQTVPFDLTGYTCTLTIGDLFTLTSGSGLTVTTGTGTIVAALTAAQTTSTGAQKRHWTLKLVDGSGTVSYPLAGDFLFVNP